MTLPTRIRDWIDRWGLEIRDKADGPVSALHEPLFAVGRLAVGRERFQHSFWTTIGRAIYHPEDRPPDWSNSSDLALLMHEATHAVDWIRRPVWFPVSYALVLPTGRTCRAGGEYRAFGMQMRVWAALTGSVPRRIVDICIRSLSGADYAWADPPRARVRSRAEALAKSAQTGGIQGLDPDDQPWKKILTRVLQ